MTSRNQFAQDFDQFVASMRSVLIAKNHDYTAGNSKDDPLYNFRRSENMGVPAWKGAMVRLSDKFGRLETFARKEHYEVNDENFYDTLRDAANYLFLISELYKEYKDAKSNEAAENRDRPQVDNEQTNIAKS